MATKIAPATAKIKARMKRFPVKWSPAPFVKMGAKELINAPASTIAIPTFSLFVIWSLKNIAPPKVTIRGPIVATRARSSTVVFSSPTNNAPRAIVKPKRPKMKILGIEYFGFGNFIPYIAKKITEKIAEIVNLYARNGRGAIPPKVNFITGPAAPQIIATRSR